MWTRRGFAALAGAGCLAPGLARAQAAVAEPPGDPRLANHARLAPALEHLRARRWRELAALVQAEPPDSACVLLDDLGDQSEVDGDLSGLERVRFGRTVAGALYVNWGWRYRGTGMASTVSDAMNQAFEERLTRARQTLEGAIDRDAHDGVAYNFLIRALKGFAPDALDSVWRDFESVRRKPVRAYAGMADALAAKWYGSHDEMLGFAYHYQDALAPGSYGLMPQACNEVVLALLRAQGSQAAMGFASGPVVANAIAAANSAFDGGGASEDFYQRAYAHGQFAFYFYLVGAADFARPHLVALSDYLPAPWSWVYDFDDTQRIIREILNQRDI